MRNKIKKYKNYIIRFTKSQHKQEIIKELATDIKNKGIVTGIRSILHKKSNFYIDPDNKQAFDTSYLSIKEYDKQAHYTLSDTSTPEVSIIIPMYNEADITYNCVCSVIENNKFTDYEIIIADDNSTENTDLFRESFTNIVIIKNEANLGFLKNCNHAASKARGKYIVFLNNDTQVQAGWLEELLYIFRNYKDAGLVGSKLIYPSGALQEAGGIIWKEGKASNYGNRDHPQRSQYNYVKETDYISGASIMILKKLWDQIGGFDERFLPAYCEDSDLCFEVRKHGYKVIYQPFSQVVHFEGMSHGTDTSMGVKRYQVQNQHKLFDKWREQLIAKARKNENIFSERDRSTGKKHVLVVDHYLPQVDKDAGSRTISNFMDALLALGYNVKFLGENQVSFRHTEKAYQLKGIEVLYGSEYNFATESWKEYLLANLNNFDAIVLSRANVCRPILAYLLKHNYKGNVIYYGHDLGYLRLEKEAIAKKDSSLAKVAKKIKADEDYMYQQADNSLAINDAEISYLKTYITRPIHYIPPYFFDVENNAPGYDEREGLFFVGGFNHPPNRDAVKWFMEEVYEPLHRQKIKLTIAGSRMPEFIVDYKEKFELLTVLPDVSIEELERLYARTRIAIVPLLSGAGVKGKVIEAMAKGVPVVGTDVAFEGMPKAAGFLYKGANTPVELTASIEQLYTNKNEWERLSEFGKSYVVKNFNKDSMTAVFKEIIG